MSVRRRRMERGPAYCRPEKKNTRTKRTSPAYCKDPDCKLRVRGPNHSEGDHHNKCVPVCRRGGW